MLQHLQIENIAIIEKLSLEPSSCFNVLTGETGAGKSIIIDSINFVLGGRVSKEIIRTGQEKSIVEAVFDSGKKYIEFFEEHGLNFDEESIILYREYNSSGKSVSRINGRIVNTSMLSEMAQLLVDMHGQHDNQSLMKSSLHLSLLDMFCGQSFLDKISNYSQQLLQLKDFDKQLKKLKESALTSRNQTDLLRFQINEILSADLKAGEDAVLENRRTIMKNWEKISDCLTFGYAQLSESFDGKTPTNDQIALVASKLLQAAPYSNDISDITERLNEVVFQLQDISSAIRDQIFSLEFSSIELEEIEERLDVILNLKRKYGTHIEDVIYYCENAKEELDSIDISPEKINEMEKIRVDMENTVLAIALEISKERKQIANNIETRVTMELEDLEMRGASFQAYFVEVPMTSTGIDKMEFMFSANKGEPVKPLSKIASGGEMSRVMLAIKSILAEVDQVPLLIFDEIDSGISGIASQKVGEKLKKLAKNHQIVCVTHHAQIAAMADRHFYVTKFEKDEKTITNIEVIETDKRIKEIGRLLSGSQVSDISLRHAQELLNVGEN